jgi:hypothetical protein
MIRLITAWGIAAVASLLSGCITPHSYVDPQYRKASYEQITRLAAPVPVKVHVQFQRNGEPLPAADAEARGHVERSLRASGVFVPTSDAANSIRVIANNIADMAAARAKGFGTGLTFGAAGTMVDDNYEFLCTYESNSHPPQQVAYQHAIHTAIGNKKGPPGLAPTTPADAFSRVVEDVILNFVAELQGRGVIDIQSASTNSVQH